MHNCIPQPLGSLHNPPQISMHWTLGSLSLYFQAETAQKDHVENHCQMQPVLYYVY